MHEDHYGRDVPLEVNIQDLIRDRKAERKLKAEEKRQIDLQRIRDMKSTIGIDPLEQFPKEIWLKLLDELEPEDRGKLWELHPVFLNLMEATRIRDILFPQILKIKAFHRLLDSAYNKTLRLVCKSSRQFFDRFMEEELIKRVREMEADTNIQSKFLENFRLNVESQRKALAKLLTTFRDGENPGKDFFTRGLSVSFSASLMVTEIDEDYDSDDDDDDIPWRWRRIEEIRNEFISNLTALLEIIGGQIWHFRLFLFKVECTPYTFSEVYMLLQRWLSLMPNLKWLEICIDDSEETIKPEDKKKSIRELNRKHPFPCLEYLERISLHFGRYSGQMEIFESLIASNPHVKILDFTDANNSELQSLPCHQIKSLQELSSFSVGYEYSNGAKFNCIQSMINVNWPLKSITLELVISKGATKLKSVFRFLENFPTLETVDLRQLHGLRIIGDDDHCGYLNLPNLLHFSVNIHVPAIEYGSESTNFFFSLQFLLHCRNLKTLGWYLSEVDDKELRRQLKKHEIPGKTIDFRSGLRFLYESNIWDVFPSLEFVSVEAAALDRNSPFDNTCEHTYRRLGSMEKVSVGKFLASHKCSRNYELQNCVVLHE